MKKIFLLLGLFLLSFSYTFAKEYEQDDYLEKDYEHKDYYTCDDKIEIGFGTWKVFFKSQIVLIETISGYTQKIFSQNKLSCEDVQKTGYGSDIEVYNGEFSKNEKDVIFGIQYTSKESGTTENHYFINDEEIFSVDYDGYTSGSISRYGKHFFIFVENTNTDLINPYDQFCQNNAGYYLNGKKVFCFENINYYPESFLQDRGLTHFFSKEIYGQEKYPNFELSESTIKKIEILAKKEKIQRKKKDIYIAIEKFNQKYEAKKLENISKVDYRNYEILNYFYGILKLEDAKNMRDENFKTAKKHLEFISNISSSKEKKEAFYKKIESIIEENRDEYLQKIYYYLKNKDVYDKANAK